MVSDEFRNAAPGCFSDRNARVAALAQRQGGHVTRGQLLGLGLGRAAIASRLRRGWLIRVHRGVYAVGHLPGSPSDRARGALLAAGPRSALSGASAAALWELRPSWPGQIELTSPLQRRIPGLVIRRCTTLIRRDIRSRDGMRVTSPARTLLDLAPLIDERRLHRHHNELRMRWLIGNRQLIDVATRNPSHPGAPRLLALAGASRGEPKRSPFEIDWQRFANCYALPEHDVNVHVAGERVDVLFTPARLIVELDGWDTHGTRLAFERDRDRDSSILAATGIPTIRITRHGLQRQPRLQVDRINAVLARRPRVSGEAGGGE